MTNRAISIFNQLRPYSVGFDSVFDHFGRMFEDDMFDVSVPNYPPYNIVKVKDNQYNIEVALAGYNKKDIDVLYEDNMLTIKTADKKEDKKTEGENIYKGIAQRMFKKSFTIADDVEVKGAELKDGLLIVSLEKIIPDHKKARTINIK
jgi:molecular chaperone IbpA|tara:strand:- start:280 stop:723 length:444 start_codon:yes stop_codon:yes gene_type:complete